jgi:hypothetical protein
MEISLNSLIKLNDDVLFQELQGEAVLLDLKTGVYFGLDKIGTRMWQLMGVRPLSGVAEAMAAEFEVSQERCEEDLLVLVARLEEQGLLSVQ